MFSNTTGFPGAPQTIDIQRVTSWSAAGANEKEMMMSRMREGREREREQSLFQFLIGEADPFR